MKSEVTVSGQLGMTNEKELEQDIIGSQPTYSVHQKTQSMPSKLLPTTGEIHQVIIPILGLIFITVVIRFILKSEKLER